MSYFDEFKATFAQAMIPRLGEHCVFKNLPPDVFKMVCDTKTFDDPSIAEIAAQIPRIRFVATADFMGNGGFYGERFTACTLSTWTYIEWACTRLLYTFFRWRTLFRHIEPMEPIFSSDWNPVGFFFVFEKMAILIGYHAMRNGGFFKGIPVPFFKKQFYDEGQEGPFLEKEGVNYKKFNRDGLRDYSGRLYNEIWNLPEEMDLLSPDEYVVELEALQRLFANTSVMKNTTNTLVLSGIRTRHLVERVRWLLTQR
jgi:hypothetical protein